MLSFIFYILLLFSLNDLVYSEECGDEKPEIRNYCFTFSTADSYCCFKSIDAKCELVKKEEFKSKSKDLDCGISEENYGKYEFGEYHPKQKFDIGFQTCGKYDPQKISDCTDYSELSNSCCYFKNENSENGCFLIGRKYHGKSEEKTFNLEGFGTITYTCNSFHIYFNIYLILLIFLFL